MLMTGVSAGRPVTGSKVTPAAPFFPATCCPPLGRRGLLVGGAAVLGAAALGGGCDDVRHSQGDARPGADSTAGQPNPIGHTHAQSSAAATAIISAHAIAPDDPWAVAHGIRAMGATFTIASGQRGVDFLLRHVTDVVVNGRTLLAFPEKVEVHPNSFLKTMLEAGVPLDYRFTHKGRSRTLADLVDGARLLFRPQTMMDPNTIPWSLIAFSRTTSTVRRRWTNAWGEQVDLDAVVDVALRDLEAASTPIDAAMRAGRPLSGKPPVHSFTCGGTHLLYGLLSAIRYGFGPKDARPRVEHQTALMVWRMGGADVDLISRFYAGLPRDPINTWRELNAKLKVLGHAEECLAFATRQVRMTLTPAQQAQRAAGVQMLHRLLADVHALNLQQVRALDPVTYQQLIGDTCHAQHGLAMRSLREPGPGKADWSGRLT